MNIIKLSLALYQFLLLFTFLNGYVLFAANLEDFRSIAKKLVPDRLADQLTEMASRTSTPVKRKQEKDRENYDIEESDESERDSVRLKNSYANKASVKNTVGIQTPDINMDELVEKVKERLEGDYKKMLQQNDKDKNPRNKPKLMRDYETPINNHKRERNNNYDKHDMDKEDKMSYIDYGEDISPKYQKYPKIENEYVVKDVETQDNKPGTDNGQLFDQTDLGKPIDSYEDYDIPKKEEAFESAEKNVSKLKQAKYSQVSKDRVPGSVVAYVDKWSPTKKTTADYDFNDEMKARTESLIEAVTGTASIDGAVPNKAKLKGTMIPTREYYKMSSPNYYAKLPAVAEMYNFDEPLPERDREPENLKHIANPPASINRKIKLM